MSKSGSMAMGHALRDNVSYTELCRICIRSRMRTQMQIFAYADQYAKKYREIFVYEDQYADKHVHACTCMPLERQQTKLLLFIHNRMISLYVYSIGQ